MAVTSTPILPQTPYLQPLDLTAQTACTTRAPTATASLAAANIIAFTAASTNGLAIDSVKLKAAGTGITTASAANILMIWHWDATAAKAFLIAELPIAAITPNTTTQPSAEAELFFKNGLWLPAANRLYAALTVTTTAAGTALVATACGGAL